ncbi:MAG: ABC transporter substrate-binding protein [Deltaproteobacteria bacterium]|nr:ABC transporter substrate-binding protein [Deltaproteobacteria bacterium]
MKKIARILTGISLCFCLTLILSTSVSYAVSGKKHPILNVRLYYDATQLDPHYTGGADAPVVCQIYDSLVKFDGDNQMAVKPSLASSWEVSKDGKEWTFHLIETKFHDGTEFTADDVVFTIERYKKSPFTAVKGHMLDHAEAIDKHNVKIYLKYPYPHFIRQLASWPWRIVSKAAVEKYGKGKKEMVIGTGPYKLEEWKVGQGVTLVSNKDYFEGEPYFEKIVMKVIADDTTAMVAFEKGELDATAAGSGLDAQMFRKKSGYKVISIKRPAAYILAMNLKLSPMENKKLRQAINHGIDKERFVQIALDGEGYADCDMLLSPYEEGYTEKAPKYEYDIKKAKALIAESGLTQSDLDKLDLTYTTASIGPRMAATVQEFFAEVGIRLKMHPMELGSFIQAQQTGRYMMTIVQQQSIPYNPVLTFNLYYKTGAYLNYARYKNPEIDKLIAKANSELNDEKRVGYFKEATKIIREEAYYAPICYVKTNMILPKQMKGMAWEPNTMITKYCDWYWEE